MQQQSAVECSHGGRLKRLRVELQMEWSALAKHLDISQSMCYQVARGTKHLSDLALFRLAEAERSAGIQVAEKPVALVGETPEHYPQRLHSKHVNKLQQKAQLKHELAALRSCLDRVCRLLEEIPDED